MKKRVLDAQNGFLKKETLSASVCSTKDGIDDAKMACSEKLAGPFPVQIKDGLDMTIGAVKKLAIEQYNILQSKILSDAKLKLGAVKQDGLGGQSRQALPDEVLQKLAKHVNLHNSVLKIRVRIPPSQGGNLDPAHPSYVILNFEKFVFLFKFSNFTKFYKFLGDVK